MNPKEFRIGNYLREGLSRIILQVSQLDKEYIYVEVASKDAPPLMDGWYKEPIPLTPEVLEKCGFEALSSAWFVKDDFKILLGWTEDFGHFFHYTTMDELVLSSAQKYLHQLQNLFFALTGEELTVNL